MSKAAWLGAALVLVVLIFLGYFMSRPASEREGIVVGAPLILSGDFTSYGTRSQEAIDLAVEDFKKQYPDIAVRVIYEDTHADPKSALSAYRKLIDVDKVDAIVGPMLQAEMGAIYPSIATDGVPVFSLSPVPQGARGSGANPLVFWPDPTREAEQMVEYVFSKGVRRIGVIGTQDAWENEVSDAFSAKFTALGGEVTAKELTLPTSKNDRVTLTKVLASKPEALFFGTYYKFFDFVKTARELGFTGDFYSIEIDTYLAEQTKGLSDGLQFISPNFYTSDFVVRYTERHGGAPTIPAGQAYDAAMFGLETLRENANRESVLAEMNEVETYEGVSGSITFNEIRRAVFPLSIFEINDGIITKIN